MISCIRNTDLQSIRAMAPNSIRMQSTNMVLVRSTDGHLFISLYRVDGLLCIKICIDRFRRKEDFILSYRDCGRDRKFTDVE